MDAVRTTEQTPWVRLVLCAVGVAVGWFALSAAFGWGAPASHASDDDRDGLLSGVVRTVDSVTDILPDAVEEPVDTAVEASTHTVEKATKKAATGVTSTADAVVKTSVTKVTQAVRETVSDAVKAVPVVGEAAEDLGVTDLVEATLGGLDDTATEVVSGVDRTVDAVVDTIVQLPPSEAVSPEIPTDPTDPAAPTAGAADSSATTPEAPPATSVSTVSDHSSVSALWRAADASSRASAAAHLPSATGRGHDPGGPGALSPLSAAPVTASFSSGSTGASTAAGSVPSSMPTPAHDAWLRTVGAEDRTAPPGPPSRPGFSPD